MLLKEGKRMHPILQVKKLRHRVRKYLPMTVLA